ncbi:hypothetical protein E2562_022986 [Oryza meyeriana var. granulata]|uniref:Uncharacterized protein n=1 Tax=Oryza meyeriana var. granulata TaxID=110450 RepID=A0A6G1EY73_9ORYZ|nr:hypothetical protein E2562_022986 [Oryza meyeriana var. granulata]
MSPGSPPLLRLSLPLLFDSPAEELLFLLSHVTIADLRSLCLDLLSDAPQSLYLLCLHLQWPHGHIPSTASPALLH